MSTEKFFRVITHLKEAKSVTAAMTPSPNSRFNSQKLQLLGLLDRVQHLVVSLRADFIDLFYFKSPYETEASAAVGFEELPGRYANHANGDRRCNILPFDRRRAAADRRRVHTFLGRDRRSGIVDRRRRRRERDAPSPSHGRKD